MSFWSSSYNWINNNKTNATLFLAHQKWDTIKNYFFCTKCIKITLETTTKNKCYSIFLLLVRSGILLSLWCLSIIKFFFFKILYLPANPANFRMRIDNWWYTIIINMYWSTQNTFNTDNALIFGLMCQHWSMNTIADCINIGYYSLEMGIDWNATFLITFNAQFF